MTKVRENEESYGGFFVINRRNKRGINVYGTHECNDEILFDFLLYIALDKVLCFSLPNSCLSDAGATILFEYLQDQFSLNTLKLYNNVMKLVGKEREIPYLLTGTLQLSYALEDKTHLQILEIHGFFFHHDDLESLCKSLESCTSIKKLQLSNNNL